MQSCINLPIIGYHRSPLRQKFGIPRQPNLTSVASYIEMVPPFNTIDAFEGLEAFSHLWVTWQAHQNHKQKTFKPKVRPPRLGGNTKLGVFATRSTYRPSQLGLSVVQLIDIVKTESSVWLHIIGADMVDATPIVDIKPYVAYSDAIPNAISGFAANKPSTKTVKVSNIAKKDFDAIVMQHTIIVQNKSIATGDVLENSYEDSCGSIKYCQEPQQQGLPIFSLQPQDLTVIRDLIAQDPRPAYRQYDTEHTFKMRYKNVDIGFRMDAAGIMWIESVTTTQE